MPYMHPDREVKERTVVYHRPDGKVGEYRYTLACGHSFKGRAYISLHNEMRDIIVGDMYPCRSCKKEYIRL
jgi:hypothetical protein